MLVHLKTLVERAQRGKYALGAFNTFNLEMTLGIIRGAMAAQSPVIIQVSETSLSYAGGIKTISGIIQTLAQKQGRNIPIALHLDHGKTFSTVVECVKSGFSSVMIDASDLPFDKNIALTKKVSDYAHGHNVWVQGELGRVVRKKEEIIKLIRNPEEFLTDPDQAQEFVEKTKVDTLAVAIGNVHGPDKMKYGPPKIFLNRLKEIQKMVKVPLVLHGASGISKNDIKKAINLGVRIINIDTEIKFAFKYHLVKSLRKKQENDPRSIFLPCIDGVAKAVEGKISIFGSQGRR